ncbi:MAG TPA: hypothetical protein VG367_13960 [Mucilaginibacter sp.]|jgi:hypothetical protein|nr:hypothetical protein [Mucilaginibacter sp.]
MNRKTLSSKSIANKVTTVILAIAVLVIWIFYIRAIGVLLFGAIIVGPIGIIAFSRRLVIEFDDDNMYIRDGGTEDIIELKCVTTLSITTTATSNSQIKWKIIYWHDKIEQEVDFYPGSYRNLDAFADLVQKKNSDAQIVRSASTFGRFW